MRVPAALVALPLLTGATAGVLLADAAPDRLIGACAGAALLCLLAGAGFLADDLPWAVVFCVGLGGALAGGASAASTTRARLRPPLLEWFEMADRTDPVLVEGVLREDAALVPYGATLSLRVTALREPGAGVTSSDGGLRLVVGGAPSPADVGGWREGRRIRVPVLLRRPAWFSDPGVADDRRAMAMRGTVLTGTIKSAALVEVLAPGGWLEEAAAGIRAWTRRAIGRHVAGRSPRSAAVATAILIGDRTGLPEEDERRLQDAGTYHVIAISGGNIAILTTLLIVAARAVFAPYRLGAAACIAVLLAYGEIAGGTASVGRAITVAVVFLAALIVDHRAAPLNVLGVAAVIAVAVRPESIVDGGFLLSFGATMGIILGVPRIVRPPGTDPRQTAMRLAHGVGRAALGVAAATVCAEVALAPIGASLFSRVTFAGLVLNFAAIPLMTAIQCGSMALLAAAGLGLTSTADALGGLVHWSAAALVDSARLVELAPWAARDVMPPSIWLSAVYYAACAWLLLLPRWRRPAAVVLAGAGLLLISGLGPSSAGVPAPREHVLRVVVLDVGQGDATVVILPDGRALLIDAGGLAGTAFDIGGRVVLPALRALGGRRLHALVLTHGDPDHVDGAEAVLRRLRPASVWEGVPVPPHATLRRLAALADARQIAWRTVRPGNVERVGGVLVKVLHPPKPEWERQRVRNDDSVVLELRYGDVSILLPGDVGREGETALVPDLELAPVVILKAAHHGSATSSSEAFLDAVRPRAVIFSAGRNNRFGHPAPVVVDRVTRRGVPMFNTATDGAVFIETDGHDVEVRGWMTPVKRLVIAPSMEQRSAAQQ